MKHIDIVIPTRNRYPKLRKALLSIPNDPRFSVKVIVDGEEVTLNRFGEDLESFWKDRDIAVFHEKKHRGIVYCRNSIIRMCDDGVLYATDDIIFQPNSIDNALRAFNEHFPDDDGIVGFVQTGNKKYHPSAVGLVGQKFLQRYPDKQLFCPSYFHFACQEIYWLASKHGIFYQEVTAGVHHLNPFIYKEELDQTHKDARLYKDKDTAVRQERKARGLIWGDND